MSRGASSRTDRSRSRSQASLPGRSSAGRNWVGGRPDQGNRPRIGGSSSDALNGRRLVTSAGKGAQPGTNQICSAQWLDEKGAVAAIGPASPFRAALREWRDGGQASTAELFVRRGRPRRRTMKTALALPAEIPRLPSRDEAAPELPKPGSASASKIANRRS